MLKIVVIFMLLTLIGYSMNTTSIDNESKNITLNNSTLNNSSLNNTTKSDLGIDVSLFNWFAKPTEPNSVLSLALILDDIRHDYLKEAIDSYATGKLMTEEDFSKRSIPPAISERLERYNPGEKVDDKPVIPPNLDGDLDEWLLTPPWKDEVPYKGCTEPICDEDGICHVTCYD